MTVWEQEPSDAPTPFLAGRVALTSQHRIRDRHGTDPERLESSLRSFMRFLSLLLVTCHDRPGQYVLIDFSTGDLIYGPFHGNPDPHVVADAIPAKLKVADADEYSRYGGLVGR